MELSKEGYKMNAAFENIERGEPTPTAPENPLINGLDLSGFNRLESANTAQNFLPNIDLALAEQCARLGSDAAACVKAVRRHGYT